MILLSFLAIFEAVLTAVAPIIYKNIINNIADVMSKTISVETGTKNTFLIAIALVVILVLTNSIYFIKNYFDPKLDAGAQKLIREKIFHHLTELSIDFYEKERVGSLIAGFNRGIGRGSSLMSQISNWVAAQVLIGIFAIGMIFSVDWVAGLIVLFATFIFVYNSRRLVRKVNPIHLEINKGYDNIGGQTFEVASGMHTVKSFVQEENEMRSFTAQNSYWLGLNIKRAKIRSIYMLGRYTVMDIARVIILIMASFKATKFSPQVQLFVGLF